MKLFKDWIIAHKLLSIVIAAVVAVGAATAIVLPIALRHEHTFATEWSHDGENHWHACTGEGCDEIKDKAAHEYDNACDADCNVCGATRTPADHDYDNACDADCNVCGTTRTPADHDYDNACDADCNVCGATRTVGEHVYDGEADADCNICGKTRELPVRYKANDETEWTAAANLKEKAHFTIVVIMGSQTANIWRNGDVLRLVGYENDEKTSEEFYVKDGDKYYAVKWIDDSVYERKDKDETYYNGLFEEIAYFVAGEKAYTDFTYSEETHKYSCGNDEHTLTFVGGAINKIESVVTISGGTFSPTITFEETTLTVPAYHTFATTWSSDGENHWYACTDSGCDVTKEKEAHSFSKKNDGTKDYNECECGYKTYPYIDKPGYENALNSKDGSGKFYSNIDIVFIDKTGDKSFQYKVTKDAAYKYSTAVDAENLETIWTNEDGKGVIYTKKDENSKWVKTVQSEKFEDVASFILPNSELKNVLTKISFENLTYSNEDQMYRGSCILGSYTMKVTLRFEDGKLVKWTRTGEKADGSVSTLGGNRTITYGNAVIEIPTATDVEKTAYAVPYNETAKKYSLEDVAFSANESKWFVFDIPEDGKNIQYVNKFSGSGKVSVGMYDASGKPITLGAFGGKFGKINLNKGKYYVMVDVEQAGSLSLNILVLETLDVPYDETAKKYSLENVSFSKGETKVFTIDVTSEMIAKFESESGCEISGGFTVSGSSTTLTLNIAAQKSSGVVIANAATDFGKMRYEGLKVGKYFIIITANEDCTGTFEMEFNVPTPDGSSKEKAIEVQYVGSDGTFVLSDVALSADEAKWFVIDITEDVFDANSEDSKCEILGEFATTVTATFTITVEPESGASLDNIASETNEFDCGISVYGKYYIKITASAACTGAWDIGFADNTPDPTPAAGSTKETAIAIDWSSTAEKFVVSDVALSTTEKWFVIEITEEAHASYKKKITNKYEIDGAFATESSATLTIVIEDASGTTITNKSSDNGKLNIASLDAGKYYIKVTATEACTGSLSVEFKTNTMGTL